MRTEATSSLQAIVCRGGEGGAPQKRKDGGNLLRPRLSKNLRELERAAALSNFQSCPAACTVGAGRFLRRKISFSREKIVSLQAPRPKNLRFLAETGEGGRKAENRLGFQVSPLAKLPTAQIEDLRRGTWPWSLLPRPPACQNFFDKRRRGNLLRPLTLPNFERLSAPSQPLSSFSSYFIARSICSAASF